MVSGGVQRFYVAKSDFHNKDTDGFKGSVIGDKIQDKSCVRVGNRCEFGSGGDDDQVNSNNDDNECDDDDSNILEENIDLNDNSDSEDCSDCGDNKDQVFGAYSNVKNKDNKCVGEVEVGKRNSL